MAPMVLALMTVILGQAPKDGGSYLYDTAFDMEAVPRGPAKAYAPQAGDIFLCTDGGFVARIGHELAGAGSGPHHSGIVVELPNGAITVLESGPHNGLRVRLTDFNTHMRGYVDRGQTIWIRRRIVPLTPDQSKALATFAMEENGKPFAVFRLMGQLTPFRSRGTIRTDYVGGPHGKRFSYFCSELVLESCIAAGILDGKRCRPAATYPCDLFYGRSPIPFIDRNLDINAAWHPPARWTGSSLENNGAGKVTLTGSR